MDAAAFPRNVTVCTKLYGRAGLSLLSAQCGISSALLVRSSSYLHKMFTLHVVLNAPLTVFTHTDVIYKNL